LKSQIRLYVVGNFPNKFPKWQLPQQQFGGLLVAMDLTERDGCFSLELLITFPREITYFLDGILSFLDHRGPERQTSARESLASGFDSAFAFASISLSGRFSCQIFPWSFASRAPTSCLACPSHWKGFVEVI
jgi:hypothetical protein